MASLILKPLVSVVVPAYNRKDVILRAVTSLLTQNFEHEFEIIVVDDGSTDGTADQLNDLSTRVRVVRQCNQGAAAARRMGIESARGEFIAFLDSDDVAEPWHLAEHWRALQLNPGAVLSFAAISSLNNSDSGLLNGDAMVRRLVEMAAPDRDGILTDPLHVFIREGCLTGSMNLMTYRDVALKASARRYDIPAANDYSFALNASRFGKFVFIERVTIRCERRDDGIGNMRRQEQFAYALLAAHRALQDSGRRDQEIWHTFKHRIGSCWPSAVVSCYRSGKLSLACRIAYLGLRHGLTRETPRRLWWAIG